MIKKTMALDPALLEVRLALPEWLWKTSSEHHGFLGLQLLLNSVNLTNFKFETLMFP